ncbi:MAG: alpha/beta fold hydrolase, partial [Myxococcota bacterium]
AVATARRRCDRGGVRQTQYVKSGTVSIAYCSTGSAEPTTLYVPGALSNMAFEDMIPTIARFWERASRIGRCVRFDKRGTGLSDRDTTALSIAEQVADIESVRRVVGAPARWPCTASRRARRSQCSTPSSTPNASHI